MFNVKETNRNLKIAFQSADLAFKANSPQARRFYLAGALFGVYNANIAWWGKPAELLSMLGVKL